MEKFKKYPVISSLLFSVCLAFPLLALTSWPHLSGILVFSLIFGFLLVYPFVLTVLNLIFCFKKGEGETWKTVVDHIEGATMILGILFSLLLFPVSDVDLFADWTKVLTQNQLHSPVWPQAWPTVCFCLTAGLLGYALLKRVHWNKMPPLFIVLNISAMYLGMGVCALWIIQIFVPDRIEWFFCLLPFNWILICIRVIREKTGQWRQMELSQKQGFRNPFLQVVNQKLTDSASWPLWAFFLLWPLMGICIIILALFGQRPDSLIRAWTETSQWNLSARISPPNIIVDEHYLCTVAAGGHRRLVKPLRAGVRHGHRVIVNRQLCVANAFEQILEEKTPFLHKIIRNFYDRYGFPVAKLIRSPYAADVVYLVMKPLEWFFLAVIYLTDTNPENRIRMQYIDPIPENFFSSMARDK